MAQAFDHIQVLDLSNRLSAAWAARLFADFGATVIMVEDAAGHPLRQEPPFASDGSSIMHAYVNWNKISVSAEKVSVPDLIGSSDVVITSQLRFPEALDDLSPHQIHLSITPNGLTGPKASEPGNNLTTCAQVGWSEINRCEGEPPLQLPHNQAGYIAGVAGFVGTAAMLHRIQKGFAGDQVDVSEVEALAETCAPWAQVGNFIGGERERMARGPNGPRTRTRSGPLWQAKNGAINFGYGDWRKWTEAFAFLGRPDIGENPSFISTHGRHQQDTRPVRDALRDSIADRDKWDIFHGLANLRCISGVVQNAKELVENEHLQARGFVIQTPIAGGDHQVAGAFAKLSETPLQYGVPAPAQGSGEVPESTGKVASTSLKTSADLPLKGIRILTFTQAWSGTFGTQLLALLGADVVQVETRKRPDVWRGAGAPVPPGIRNPDIKQDPLNNNGMYNTVNHNKKAINLDVTTPEGKEIFWQMIPNFDIITDNFSPHVMSNWGVTLETLQEKRPDMIFASLSGYGRTGPLAEYPANGATTEPMAGLASIHGYIGDVSQNTGGLIPDPISGYYFASAILAAINYRDRTGKGQRIDLSMYESIAQQVGDAMLEYSATGHIRAPSGNSHPRIAPHNVYQSKDERWIAVAAENDVAFQRLASITKLDYLRFSTMAERKAKEDELDGALERWIARYEMDDILSMFANTGITHNEVMRFQPIYKEPNAQFLARQFMVPVTHPESGTHYMPLNPFVFENTPRGEITHSPCFGQHSAEVLAQEVGLDHSEYVELEAKGITGTERLF